MIQENKWTTTFQVTVPLLDMPKGFKKWQKTFLDRLLQEIELVREELGYEVNTSAIDKIRWRLENRNKVRERMLEIPPKYWQPEDDEFVNLLETIFYEGIESSLTMNSLNALDFGGAAPLFFKAVALPPEIDKLKPQQREFLTNDLYVEGRIPGLSSESFEQIFKRKGDYVIRGNLALFNADAFRAIGNWLGEIKTKLDAGEVFGFKRGRRTGIITIKPQADERALEMYEIYQNVKNTYKGKRKRRKNRSRYNSMYDEVGCNYEAKYRLEFRSISRYSVKYLMQKGKRIYEKSVADKGRINSA